MKPTPPALPGLPLVGNIPEFVRDRNGLIRRGYEAHGPIFSFRLGAKHVVALLGPELQQLFFTETDKALSIEKPYENLAAMFGKVAFLAPKEIYQDQHPVLYAPFKPAKMAGYVAVMQREVQAWIDRLGPSGQMELSAEMGGLVQSVAGYALMGEDFQRRVGAEFWQLYTDLGKSLSLIVPPHWPVPRNIRRDRAKRRMAELLKPVIAERRRNPDGYDDMLQQFVNTRLRSGGPADDETLIGLLRALMFASHETTAGQSAWTLIELLRHPEHLARTRQEVDEVLAPGAPIDGGALRRLENVYWAVREVERLHPSADALMRVTEQEIEVGDYRVPAGWLVMAAAGIAHRLPGIFSDPDRFDPLRFAPDRAEDKAHGYTLIGFGGGKHKCAGMNFAVNEMMLITALTLRQLDLELLTPNPGTTYGQGAARPEPTQVRYTRRPGRAPQPAATSVAAAD